MWNEEFAVAAQTFARTCSLESNPLRYMQLSGFNSVGEAWTAVGSSKLKFILAINSAWYQQRRFYNYDKNKCSAHDACSSYLQVIMILLIQ